MNGNPFGGDEWRQRGGFLFNHGPSSQAQLLNHAAVRWASFEF
jgi:hypothetical protein